MIIESKKIEAISNSVNDKMVELFTEDHLNQLAQKNEFIQRKTSRLNGADFIELMTTGIISNTYEPLTGLCDILEKINPDAKMSPQALSQRINCNEAVDYLAEVFNQSIQKNLEPLTDKLAVEILAPFNRIFLEDSTQCTLHEKLADTFKGSGGSASKSILKIDLIYELKQNILQEVYITDCKEPDQALAERILESIQENDLTIRDLGYYAHKAFAQI